MSEEKIGDQVQTGKSVTMSEEKIGDQVQTGKFCTYV